MNILDKFLSSIRVNDDFDDDDEFFDEEDFEEEEKPKRGIFGRFVDETEEDDDDILVDGDDEEEEVAPKRDKKTTPKTQKTEKAPKAEKADRTPKAASSSKITPMKNRKQMTTTTIPMEVCVIKPTTMDDTRDIADTLIDNCTVILNLEGIDVELAQRIIDFSSGACYSLKGRLQKISSYIFVLTPEEVEISGDFQEILNGSVEGSSARVNF